MRTANLLAYGVVFLASFCTLVIELVAGHILAPYVGQSLYTWTSIIGVILAGISVGNYVGGLVADRFPKHATLGWLLFASGLVGLTIPILADTVGLMDPFNWTGWYKLVTRILLTTVTVFFIPSMLLGMISPVVVKLSVSNLAKTGNVVGKIYAFSTLGALVGTFVTGFYLVEAMGTRALLYTVGGVLILSAPIFGGLFAMRGAPRVVLICACIFLFGFLTRLTWSYSTTLATPVSLLEKKNIVRDDLNRVVAYNLEMEFKAQPTGVYRKESSYYTIKVSDYERQALFSTQNVPVRDLVLDNLIHSHTSLEDPSYLHYHYLRIYEELVAWKAQQKANHRSLFIGGGGYTLPRFLIHTYPQASVDVAEIDPWVTKTAYEWLGVNDKYIDMNRLHSHNGDARWFVMNCQEKFDFIFGDAFNDLSIPYHLTTKEFDENVKRLLTPDGLYMALVIDNVGKGLFLPAYIKTVQTVFGEGNVALLLGWEGDPDQMTASTVIVVAGMQRLDLKNFGDFLEMRKVDGKNVVSHIVSPERLKTYMQTRKRTRSSWFGKETEVDWEPFILTDDYCPVDNLTAPMFEERHGYKKDESSNK